MRAFGIEGLLKRPPPVDRPEEALMAAVLADAMTLLLGRPARPRRRQDHYAIWRARRDAARWVRQGSTDDLFGFGTICDVLDLDVAALQGALEQRCDLTVIARRAPSGQT